MADHTEKAFFGDDWITYHDDGTTSRTYKDLNGNLRTVHSDGSESVTVDNFFDDGQTTYHEDGSKSYTHDSFFGDSKITYNDDGSSYETYESVFGGYNTVQIHEPFPSEPYDFSDPYNPTDNSFDNSDSIGSNAPIPREIWDKVNRDSSIKEKYDKRLWAFYRKINVAALVAAVLEVGLFILCTFVHHEWFYSGLIPQIIIMLVIISLLGFLGEDNYWTPSKITIAGITDLFLLGTLSFRYSSWKMFLILVCVNVVAWFIGFFYTENHLVKKFKSEAIEETDKEIEVKKKAEADRIKKKEEQERKEAIKAAEEKAKREAERNRKAEEERARSRYNSWQIVGDYTTLKGVIPAQAEYFVLPNNTVETKIPYNLFTSAGPAALSEAFIRKHAGNIAFELARAKVPFNFYLTKAGEKTGVWMWDYGEYSFVNNNNHANDETVHEVFALTDKGELKTIFKKKTCRDEVIFVDDIITALLENCNISWYTYEEEDTVNHTHKTFRGRNRYASRGIRSFETQFEGIFSRLLFLLNLTEMTYAEFASKYRYRTIAGNVNLANNVKTINASIDTVYRHKGDKDWAGELKVETGDILEFQVHFKNLSEEKTTGVTISEALPAGLEYVPDTTVLYNATNPQGLQCTGDILSKGVGIGTYNPGGDGYLRFEVKVTDINGLKEAGKLMHWTLAAMAQCNVCEAGSVKIID